MELLLRHAINYLAMHQSTAVTDVGIIDDEDMLVRDMDKLMLHEAKAVLCVHMLCYVLDGSVGFSEMLLWKRLLTRVEECYKDSLSKLDTQDTADLRKLIAAEAPNLRRAVDNVVVGATDELEQLHDIF
eukprot:SAG31_NODE_23695_length_498_cov_1.032581_1_plen_128_part_10